MLKLKILTGLCLSSFFSLTINSSPTSNEFVPCKKLAVALLEMCLKDDGNECWADSKKQYESCIKKVMRSHIADSNRTKAAIKAKQAREKQEKHKEQLIQKKHES